MKSQNFIDGAYGSFCVRHSGYYYGYWSCYESSDWHYLAVVDDFGNMIQVTNRTNMRGY